jgi:hypothetical protein
MGAIRRGLWAAMGVTMVAWVGAAMADPPTAGQRCEARKNRGAGAAAQCLAREHASELEGRAPNFTKCGTALTQSFAAAEKAGQGTCPTSGDAAAIESRVSACVAAIAGALAGTPSGGDPPDEDPPGEDPPPGPDPAACVKVLATGQTRCWSFSGSVIPCPGTGQDGEFRTGASLSYTDNGDGTITDHNTGLMWEKKSDDGSIHDKGTEYSWGEAFRVFIAGLNAEGFAGYTDWRLPNVRELQTIVNFDHFEPSVSPAFNNGCVPGCTVLTCSCTGSASYWSSSTSMRDPRAWWYVGFFIGGAGVDGPTQRDRVRAVRGGL